MATPIQDLKVGQVVQIGVRMPKYIVLDQTLEGTAFLTDELEILVVEDGGYALTFGIKGVTVGLNTDSGISHRIVNGKAICGNRWNRGNTITDSTLPITCEVCNELLQGRH